MQNKTILIIILVLLSLKTPALAAFPISPQNPQPGDAVFVLLNQPSTTSSSFNGKPAFPFFYQGKPRLVFSIPLDQKPGDYPLSIVLADGTVQKQTIPVKKRAFEKVVLGIPEKLDLTPQTLTQKLATEKKNLASTFESSTTGVNIPAGFGLPLFDNRRMGSPFGEIRQTGTSVIRHLGVDFTAREGKPVAAMNDGVVVKAYVDTVYGNSVIIDHGARIFTMYLHLQAMRVNAGETVRRGQVVGTVGQTGYATAPHLHLTVKVGEQSVDPLHFIRYLR